KGDLAAYLLVPKGYGDAASRFQYASASIQLGIDPKRNAEAGMLQGLVSEAAYRGMADKFKNPGDMRKSVNEGLESLKTSTADPAAKRETARFLRELDTYLQSGASSSSGSNFTMEGPKIESVAVSAEGKQPASPFEITFPQAI